MSHRTPIGALGAMEMEMAAMFTIRIEDEAGNVVREMGAALAKDAAAALKAEMSSGAFYGEVINNHYGVVQFRANRSTYATFS
jgi:hypothetical protein